jgi:ubiquinone/menaquinone biosynthesis C-methylase UbiE
MLDELAGAGRENLDPDHVARYDGKMDAAGAHEVALLADLGLGSDSVVVDIGAGTGQFTLAAAHRCARVVAVDISPVMLARLQERVGALGLENVAVVRGGFLTYVHEGDPADVVYSRYALHHLPDFWKAVALSRLRAMVRPGGLLRLWDVVWNFDPGQAADRIEAWCATAGTQVEGEWSRDELEEHVREEHSTFTWLLEPMIERAGFTIEEATYSADGVDAQYVLRAR